MDLKTALQVSEVLRRKLHSTSGEFKEGEDDDLAEQRVTVVMQHLQHQDRKPQKLPAYSDEEWRTDEADSDDEIAATTSALRIKDAPGDLANGSKGGEPDKDTAGYNPVPAAADGSSSEEEATDSNHHSKAGPSVSGLVVSVNPSIWSMYCMCLYLRL